MNAKDMLDELQQLRAATEVLRLDYEAARKEAMVPVQDQLDDIDAEFKGKLAAALDQAEDLETAVKDAVLAEGTSIKGATLHAIVSKGRVSWDTAKLEGIATVFPQILAARKEGAPSVAIRAIK